LQGRQRILARIDEQRRMLDQAGDLRTYDAYQQKALNLLTSSTTAKAFQLADESASMRDRYGRTQFGQGCLLGRRLAEAGVPVINVHYCRTPTGSWDTHGNHFRQMK